MAKTGQEINFNYNKAKQQAKTLGDIASAVKKVGNNKMTNSLSNVSKSWTGENASAYTKKGNKLKGKIEKTSNNIDMVASTLIAMAKNIYDAEMASISEIQEKS